MVDSVQLGVEPHVEVDYWDALELVKLPEVGHCAMFLLSGWGGLVYSFPRAHAASEAASIKPSAAEGGWGGSPTPPQPKKFPHLKAKLWAPHD